MIFRARAPGHCDEDAGEEEGGKCVTIALIAATLAERVASLLRGFVLTQQPCTLDCRSYSLQSSAVPCSMSMARAPSLGLGWC